MKRFLFSVAAIALTMCLALTARSKPATDSDVSGNGSSTDVTSAEQSANPSDNGSFSADDPLSAEQSEASTESRISSADGEQSAYTSASEETSEAVAVVTPSKPDDTSADSKGDTSATPIDTPVDITTDPAKPTESKAPVEDNTSAEHVHSYSARRIYKTCTTDGYVEHKCSCGDSYKTDVESASGYKLYRYSTITEATVEAEGEELWKCSYCSYTETKTTPKLVLYTVSDEEIELICDKFIELLNEERAKLGAPALSTAPIAHEMAMVRANELTVLFSHQRPNYIEGVGSDSATIYYEYKYNPADTGYYVATGESCCMPFKSSEDIAAIHTNAITVSEGYEKTADKIQTDAYNTAYSMIMNFSRSAGHWADLTNPEYTGVGVGYAYVSTPDGFSKYLCVMTMDKTYG